MSWCNGVDGLDNYPCRDHTAFCVYPVIHQNNARPDHLHTLFTVCCWYGGLYSDDWCLLKSILHVSTFRIMILAFISDINCMEVGWYMCPRLCVKREPNPRYCEKLECTCWSQIVYTSYSMKTFSRTCK